MKAAKTWAYRLYAASGWLTERRKMRRELRKARSEIGSLKQENRILLQDLGDTQFQWDRSDELVSQLRQRLSEQGRLLNGKCVCPP